MAKRRAKRKARKAPAAIRKPRKTAKRPAVPVFARKAPPPPEITTPSPIIVPPRVSQSRRKSKKEQQLQIAEAYRVINASHHGRMVFTDLMMMCGAYSAIESNDPIALAKAMERKNMACHIAQMLGLRDEHFPDEAWKTADHANELIGA